MQGPDTRNAPAVPDGWSVESVKYHYTVGYWVLYVLGNLLTTPSADSPDVTYTVRHEADQTVRAIRLPGDHSPNALIETIRLIQAGSTS